ncbi:nucleotidyltransferase family protein [Pedobacter foliorum]|uniref:nucleotidyltransferase family protein n=1 Tax=Pedobacter foliorum TaxID=2739058 RepID=UPI0015661E36|nr:nucleotidyltransferase family protein [Pedobacter foliorum]NRF39145.1 NTP transferase domain-containing protein [Pedobacter foliorum]
MQNRTQHIVNYNHPTRIALKSLDILGDNVSRTLFVVDDVNRLVGALTDGDIRRGLLNGLEISEPIQLFMNTNFKFLKKSDNNLELIRSYREAEIHLIPLIDDNYHLLDVLDLKKLRTQLPLAALIMAGGRGERLRPLTEVTPKPMLKVGDKPIIEHNIDRLIAYGIKDIFISVKYLKDQIIDYFGNGDAKGIHIQYIEETEPLGTIGALGLIHSIEHEDILVMNSDLLTNIDFEDFYNFYKINGATMALASVPYHVNIPYAVLETSGHLISSFSEKPSYTYYSNAGIYLMKFELKNSFEKGQFFNATDLMDNIIADIKRSLVHYPLLGYWLDIGKHNDLIKAQEDIKHIKL